MKIYKKWTAQKVFFLVNDKNLSFDNPFRFTKNLLKWIYNKNMTIDYQIRAESYNMI